MTDTATHTSTSAAPHTEPLVRRGRHRKPRPRKVLLAAGGLALAAGALSLVRMAPDSGVGAPGTAEAEPRLGAGGATDRSANTAVSVGAAPLPSATSTMGGVSGRPTPSPTARLGSATAVPTTLPVHAPASIPTTADGPTPGTTPRPPTTPPASAPPHTPEPPPTRNTGTPTPTPSQHGGVCLPVIGLCVNRVLG
ncbi:hypothetical protein [Streptomyces sp. NPDC020298]|uniref:hypothetical protein n=1 Tax=unclassified Streptomyces TaxID=2593676 RepID=UPI003405697F